MRYFQFVESARKRLTDHGYSVPEDLAAVCQELDYRLDQSAEAPDVTMVTQLSFDRINLLPRLLAGWTGPASVTLYLRDSDLEALAMLLERWNLLNSDRAGRSSPPLQIHVVYQEGEHYPVNFLRNVALDGVSTMFVFVVDIDFVVPASLYATIRARMATTLGATALIIPAFETDLYAYKLASKKAALVGQLRGSKSDLLNLSSSSSSSSSSSLSAPAAVRPFRVREWPAGHNLTNFARWAESSAPYVVEWQQGCEPYVVVSSQLPRFV